ncbi:PLP-dependent aminotransferase family protein [Streptomyces luomodiensis]|uniref:PLP-dependent aminotransferase family protein n=1 Tax=Streptomyces luomodiensis TaxID=3026192 RepID=A0ABY9UZ79_9ACTN|nr:PLP-dependent aminotransferase family protein [Streptomyces sp. SCA4-21]WNE97154.1 PLP-dependent aminotransferase family protein [Streptomyces sp. SCA4-21]
MADSWATSPADEVAKRADGGARPGADLHLDLPRGGGTGVRAALIRALRDAVRTGRLAPGTRLPSSRSLAADLGIARNTVADAYGELVAEGWLTARQGSGTRVARRVVPPEPAPPRTPPAAAVADLRPAYDPRPAYDLRPGSPDVSAFPRSAWLSAARRALTAAPNDAFGYGRPAGRPELRRVLADYLARARGVRAAPERIVVCAGFVQGLALLSRVRARAGHREVAVESYGLDVHWNVMRGAGLRTVPLPVDQHGARTAELDRLTARTVLLTPAHQFPTGVRLVPDRRAAVVDWASRVGGLVLEDDYDGEFRYDRQPVGALQGLAPEHVVYLGTASKSLAPALRLAWMVVPDHLMDDLLAVKATGEWQSGGLDQLTLAEFIDSGAYDRHVRGMRMRYRRRRDQLVAALAERAPEVRITGIAAGLHAVLELPPGTERSVVQGAAWQGLALEGLARYRYREPEQPEGPGEQRDEPGPGEQPDGPGPGLGGQPDALVFAYGAPPDHAFTGALDALCRVLP